ncbi:MAG: carbohydrate binding domain-containing protein, partial [Chloroflexota bacterium]|nr:carbohydrate binding domain-containing protein [Chloroflexota bacterium]
PLHDPPDNTFSRLMQYDVIAFKSCYPVSNIWGDEHLAEYKGYYLAIRDRIDQYPDKLFIIVTQPPQVPAESDPQEGARARAFADWLSSDEFLAGHPNLFTFDFFGHLAGADNFLRPEYRVDEHDAHPNEQANRAAGPLFVNFVDQAINSYESGTPRPTPTAPAEQPSEAEATEPPLIIAPLPTAGLIEDFESTTEPWDVSSGGEGSMIECGADAGFAHGGAASLRIHYDIAPDGWTDCGQSFESPQDWSGGTGISLWLRSEEAGEWVTLMLFAGNPDAPTPFEVDFETTTESVGGWAQVIFPWTEFVRAEWADEGGLAELEPARVTGYGFSIGADGEQTEGIFWVDDVALITGAERPQPAPIAEATEEPGEEPVEEPEQEPGGGFCSGAAALPLGAVGVMLANRRRRRRK